MRNLLSVSDDISAKVLFIIEEDGRDAGYLKACTMWNMDATIDGPERRSAQTALSSFICYNINNLFKVSPSTAYVIAVS